MLVIKHGAAEGLPFDAELLGAEFLLEEYWSQQAHASGRRLAVHRNLGVMVDQDISWDLKQRAVGRAYLAEKLKFSAFATVANDDPIVLSAPVVSGVDAVAVLNVFFASPEQGPTPRLI